MQVQNCVTLNCASNLCLITVNSEAPELHHMVRVKQMSFLFILKTVKTFVLLYVV